MTDLAHIVAELEQRLQASVAERDELRRQQTATAEILKVIAASPSDVQPVFEAIAERSNRLLSGHSTAVWRFADGEAHLVAFTLTDPKGDTALRALSPMRVDRFPLIEAIRRGESIHFADTESLKLTSLDSAIMFRDIARTRGYRSQLLTPLLGPQGAIGFISVTRKEPGAFAPQHVELLRTFADQAVIAIQNVKLCEELQARTRDLTESLQQQTTTADVLKVISRSAFDLQAVLDALVQSAAQLTDAAYCFIFRREADKYQLASSHGFSPEYREWMQPQVIEPGRHTLVGRTALEARTVHLPDVLADPDYTWGESIRRGGFRTMLGLPLLREGVPIGVIAACRPIALPFTEKQIGLITTFADQAVIAIENARLFDEVQARTEDLSESLRQQTATSEILQIISSSPGNVDPVFQTILARATRLCEADFGILYHYQDEKFAAEAMVGVPPKFAEWLLQKPRYWDSSTALGRVAELRQTVHIHDVQADPLYQQGHPLRVVFVDMTGARSFIAVPMLKDDALIGSICIFRQEMRPFANQQIEVVTNFAKQAVIAIENARLLNELRQRTDDLTRSLDDLRTAQDRLVQTEKLASLGQLTAGIAHEIKNPLNFVNNFSALSADLIDDMRHLLSDISLETNKREELNEITQMLKANLEKVVQHGKRANSIVKNMLLHSREGSGEHRSVDINSLVEESLNLAYHGARAEKPGFNVTLRRDLDPDAGAVELYPQEITRALLNLISNGFYAAIQRKSVEEETFEPVLIAATKNRGKTVEIRIRDNGTGITDKVKEKIFNPFFTTKPSGEGTGLGLSMSHDIIVKQHGGTIEVETEPGQFTEFKIVLPRRGQK